MEFGAVLTLKDLFTKPIQKATGKLNTFRSALERAKQKTEKFRQSQESAKNTVNGFTKSLREVGIALGTIAIIKKSAESYMNFEDTMLRVQATLGGTTKDYEMLETAAKKMGRETAFSAQQAAEAEANFAQAGMNAKQIYNALPSALALASAGHIDLGKSAEMSARLLNTYNIKATESMRISDGLAKGASISTANVTYLGTALLRTSEKAEKMHLSFEQMGAIVATLAPTFVDAGSAGTGFNSVVRDLEKNQSKLGFKIFDNSGKFIKFSSIIDNLKEKTKGMTEAAKSAYLGRIFGDEAIIAANALLKNTKTMKEYTKELEASAGFAKKVAELLESRLGGAVRTLMSQVGGLAIEIGKFLTPAFKAIIIPISALVSALTSVFEFLDKNTTFSKLLTVGIYSLTAALLAEKISVLGAAAATNVLTIAQGALNIATKIFKLELIQINALNPFGWIAIGITLIGVMYEKFVKFRNLLKSIANIIPGINFELEDTEEKTKEAPTSTANTIGDRQQTNNNVNTTINQTNKFNTDGKIDQKTSDDIARSTRAGLKTYNYRVVM